MADSVSVFLSNLVLTPTLTWLSGLFLSLVGGVTVNFVWDQIKDRVSYHSSNYTYLRGEWRANITLYTSPRRIYVERMLIQQQFGRRFKERLITPHPDPSRPPIAQHFQGELLSKYYAIYSYRAIGDEYTEIGSGVIEVSANHDQMHGASITLGVSSKQLRQARFSATKVKVG